VLTVETFPVVLFATGMLCAKYIIPHYSTKPFNSIVIFFSSYLMNRKLMCMGVFSFSLLFQIQHHARFLG
jgi:hypothetical protein